MKEYITGIQHIGIPTENMKVTKEFYEKLGFVSAFETLNDGAQVVFLQLKNLVIEAYEVPKAAGKTGSIDHVAVTVTDVEKVYGEICAMGLNTTEDEIHFLPFWDNGVRFFTIAGPNGERVEFSQYL